MVVEAGLKLFAGGVPDEVHGSSDRPGGSDDPGATLHAYGGRPPLALNPSVETPPTNRSVSWVVVSPMSRISALGNRANHVIRRLSGTPLSGVITIVVEMVPAAGTSEVLSVPDEDSV